VISQYLDVVVERALCSHCIGGCLGPVAGVDGVVKISYLHIQESKQVTALTYPVTICAKNIVVFNTEYSRR
jgi:hypothetical protein